MIAWVSCVCPAKNVVIGVLIFYVVQWGESADIYFEVKLISFYFYILCFTDFISTCILVPGKLPLIFSLINIWIMFIQVQVANHYLLIH